MSEGGAMSEYERRVVEALERIADALGDLAQEPARRREEERRRHVELVHGMRMRQAVEGVAEVVELPEPARERVARAREIVHDALVAVEPTASTDSPGEGRRQA